MSDSTIDDAIRLLESGKGNQDRLKQIIELFETRSLISIPDRKYVEALVQQYLTPRHRIKIKKIEPIKKQRPSMPRTLKSTKPEFDFEKDSSVEDTINLERSVSDIPIGKICSKCGYQNSAGNNFCNNCGSRITELEEKSVQSTVAGKTSDETSFEKYEREYLARQYEKTKDTVKEEKTVEYLEAESSLSKKPNKKFIGIGIGILALIVVIGGGLSMIDNTDFSTTEVDERLTCDNNPILVSSTKIPGFPNPEKDLQYYLDRYNDEPNYKEWFDRNFPGQTIEEVLVVTTSGPIPNNIPNFPNPEKDLQYYLDRYNDEPNYKEWFDRNFPGQTIEEVVC